MKIRKHVRVNLQNSKLVHLHIFYLLILLAIATKAIGEDNKTIYIDHDINGKFYGATNVTYDINKNYIFRVSFDNKYLKQILTNKLDSYLITLSNITEYKQIKQFKDSLFLTENAGKEFEDDLLLLTYEILKIKNSLLTKYDYLLGTEKIFYENAFNNYTNNFDYHFSREFKFIPSNEQLFPELYLHVNFFSENEQKIIKCGQQTIGFELEDSCRMTANLPLEKDITRISYEIRSKNYDFRSIVNWYMQSVNYRLPSSVIGAKNIYLTFKSELAKEIKNANEQFKNPNSIFNPNDYKNILQVLKIITDNYPTFKQDYINWFKKWIWLNNGKFTYDPYGLYFNNVAINTQAINTLELELVEVQAKIDLYEKQITKATSSVNSNINSQLNSTESKTNDYSITEAAKWFRQKKEIEDKIKKLSGREVNNRSKSLVDKLLYNGQFYFSPNEYNRYSIFKQSSKTRYIFHRHHDALNDYLLMENNPITEVSDGQRLYVMVHNLTTDQEIEVNYNFNFIPTNLTIAEEQLTESTTKSIMQSIDIDSSEYVKKACQNIILLSRISKITQQIPRGRIDNKPNYYTKIKTHDLPSKIPNKVTYSLEVKKENGENITVGNGEYRINKLFVLRWKAGMVYSSLNKSEYIIDDANNISYSEKQYGIDATFGIQSFFGRTDIRKRAFRFNPFIYTGIGLKDNPIENWYVGAGLEVFNGLGIMAGAHIGKSEKLVLDGGNLMIKEYYPARVFYSILIDTSVFKQLFQLNTIDNPFRKTD